MDLDLEQIRQGIQPGRLIFFESIDSTNSFALSHVDEFEPGTRSLILAEEQTQGRGRGDKPWVSTAEALLFTLLLHAQHPDRLESIGSLSLLIAQTTAECIDRELDPSGHEVQIKWPNDLILEGRKLGGILIETKAAFGGHAICIGIGLNINTTPVELGGGGIGNATSGLQAISLAESSGRPHDRTRLLIRLCQRLFAAFDSWRQGHGLQTAEIERRLFGVGRRGRIVNGESETSGRIVGIDAAGGLLIDNGYRICRAVSGTLIVN